jgi:hypothetical protein
LSSRSTASRIVAAALAAHEGLDGQAALRRRWRSRDRSRRPSSAMPSVRGIGVAVSVEHVDLGAQRLHALLVAHAEAVLLVDDDAGRGS